MSDEEDLAAFRANQDESQQESQYKASLADAEVQQRWFDIWTLIMTKQRLVQGGKFIAEEPR